MRQFTLLPLLLVFALFVGCDSDSTSPGGGGGGGGDTPSDVSGDWSITENVDATACGDGTYEETYDVTITQTGTSIVVVTPVGTFNGAVTGNQVSWTGSYPDNGGTVTFDSTQLTVSTDGNSLAGSLTWTWTSNDGLSTCSASSTFSGDKQPTTGLDVTGTWSIVEDVNATACGVDPYQDTYQLGVVQTGSALSVTAPAGVFSGSISGNTLRWTGSYYDADDGGTVTITSLTVTVNTAGTSLSGSSSWIFAPDGGGDSCAGTTSITGTKAGI